MKACNRRQWLGASLLGALSLATACRALAADKTGAADKPAAKGKALPARDLTVEFRQIEEGRESGGQSYAAGASAAGTQAWEPQMVQVRNGETARLQLSQAIPMQWVESVAVQATGGSAGSGAAATTGAGVKNALQWFVAGQSLRVRPRWSGGRSEVLVELEVQRSAAEAQTHGDLPHQARATVSTTVTVPLAEWVTIAATGRGASASTYSSNAATQARRLLQIRVMAP